jgi:hypothetical protein
VQGRTQIDGPLLVIAGAGRRQNPDAHLSDRKPLLHGIPETAILALTFTN